MEAEHGGPRVQWTPQSGGYGVQFDASAALTPDGFLPTWTVWGGGSVDRPTWDIHASPYTPAAVLRPLTVELTQAHSPPTGLRGSVAATSPRPELSRGA
ncbi:DUF317 domain-containing protein [Streptomyces lydicamycinicus]|uniref:DUF317 domain-containing protein n=1 Tax=Streptomyces lydicamycinicus TaxID=1546107 RepID=UPI003C2C439C